MILKRKSLLLTLAFAVVTTSSAAAGVAYKIQENNKEVALAQNHSAEKEITMRVKDAKIKEEAAKRSEAAKKEELKKQADKKTAARNASFAAAASPTPAVLASAGLSGKSFYIPQTLPGRNMGKAEGQPMAAWFGDWSGNIRTATSQIVSQAVSAGQMPVLVAYNIPFRDMCGEHSVGGAESDIAYKQWINEFAAGIAGRESVVILEPDALPGTDCLSGEALASRYALLSHAVTTLKAQHGTRVYIDAGNPGWVDAATTANRIKQLPYLQLDGFALNVSNYYNTQSNIVFGNQVASHLGGMKYVIDTSRNGNGINAPSDWCNSRGRALGEKPTSNTGQKLVDAYLWIKIPGESDGTCNGGPAAGQWWQEYMDELSRNAAY